MSDLPNSQADHGRDGATVHALREGEQAEKASPDTHVQVSAAARLSKTEATIAEKEEFLAFMHGHRLTLGQLARWWECSEADAHRMVSLEHPDRRVSRAHIRCLPVSLQRAIAWGDTQRLSATTSGVLPRTERLCRVAREGGDVFRFEGESALPEIDEAIAELQELRREEIVRAIEKQRSAK